MKPIAISPTPLLRSLAAFSALVLGLSLTIGRASAADPDPETAAAAKRLLAVMKIREQMAPALDNVVQMQDAILDQQGLTDDQKAAAKEIMETSMAETRKAMAWETIEPMFVRIYSGIFTAGELNSLSDFFEGPDGKVFVDKQPAVQAATMQEMQKLMMDIMPAIQEKTRAAIEKARGGQ